MSTPTAVVDIVLATYKGAKYLPQQLASLERQTYPYWRLLIRDDGSDDTTCELIEAFWRRHPTRVTLLSGGTRSGAVANFSQLLLATTAPYVMCCDQDDVWDNDKVAFSLKSIQQLEAEVTAAHPLLLHTDLRVTDATLVVTAPSFWRYAKLYPQQSQTLSQLLVQNVVTGCTLLCNRALLTRALPIPTAAIMHDWWLALVASAFGTTHALPRATLSYRQHGSNALGAQQFGTWQHLKRAWQQQHLLAAQKRCQAAAFFDRYAADLQATDRQVLEIYLSLQLRHGLVSRYLAWRYRLKKQGWLRQLVTLVCLKQP